MQNNLTQPTTDHAARAAKAHPFELSGMGTGPYAWVGMVSIPSPSLAEANADAYANAMRELPRHLVGGCGTCANCGMGIMNICIVRDAQGREYGVGTDCIAKVDDKALGEPAKVALAKHQREIRRVKSELQRAARRVEWLQAVCWSGETNAARLAREEAELTAGALAQEKAEQDRATAFADVLPHLSGCEFFDSLAEQLKRGPLSGRQAQFAARAVLGKKRGDDFDALCDRLCA